MKPLPSGKKKGKENGYYDNQCASCHFALLSSPFIMCHVISLWQLYSWSEQHPVSVCKYISRMCLFIKNTQTNTLAHMFYTVSISSWLTSLTGWFSPEKKGWSHNCTACTNAGHGQLLHRRPAIGHTLKRERIPTWNFTRLLPNQLLTATVTFLNPGNSLLGWGDQHGVEMAVTMYSLETVALQKQQEAKLENLRFSLGATSTENQNHVI